MGYSSYLCKHCDHGIVDAGATTEGINEWMAHAVMLADNGAMQIEPEYGGYSGDYSRYTVWVHHACWELAGKPEFDAYDGSSKYDPDQGGGSFRGSHDMIDPRIKDEDERARLLAAGIQLRDEKRYTYRAQQVHDWMDQEDSDYHREKHNGEMSKIDGEYTKLDNAWVVYDELDKERDEVTFAGTEDELKAHLTELWETFLASSEHAAYMAHREAEIAKYRAEELEKYKVEGRFDTTYGPKRDKDGKEIWPVHRVNDKLRYKTDAEWFHGDGCKTRCAAKAKILNDAWVAAGHPAEFEHELFVEETYGSADDDEDGDED